MKKAGKILITIVAILLLTVVGFSAYLLKDVPSINTNPQSFCYGDKFSLKGRYLSYSELPPELVSNFKQKTNYKLAVGHILLRDMPSVTTLVHHIRFALIVMWLEQFKEEDLFTFYFNSAYYGNGCYGLDAASKAFYNKDASALTSEEITNILARLKAPSKFTSTSP